jgi:hypothetical protein
METEVIDEREIDFLNYTDKQEKEWDLIQDLQQKEMEETCFRLVVKDLKTGKKVLNLVTEQITMDQEFDMDMGQDVMTLKILLSDEHIESSGDKEYMGENNEKY